MKDRMSDEEFHYLHPVGVGCSHCIKVFKEAKRAREAEKRLGARRSLWNCYWENEPANMSTEDFFDLLKCKKENAELRKENEELKKQVDK